MLSERILVISVPNNTLLYLPIYLWVKKIILLDTSHLDGFDRSTAIEKFYKWLSWLSLDKKIEQHGRIEHYKLIWDAKILAAKLMKRKVRNISRHKSISYYFANYLSHRELNVLSKQLFIRKLVKQLTKNQKTAVFYDVDYFIPKYIKPIFQLLTGVIFVAFLPLLLFFILLRIVINKTSLVFHKTKKFQGGIALDLLYGLTLDNTGCHSPGIHSDSFFINDDSQFSIKQHVFLDYGWFNTDFTRMEADISELGAMVFGIRSFKPKLEFRVLLNLIARNIGYSFKLLTKDLSYLKLSNQLILVKFLANIFEVQICFTQVRPSVYFSRMDYSYLHHALGAVCHDLDIHFAGICHSPGGGLGLTNQSALLSFDTYFIYKPIFADNFSPTWKNDITELVPIGVWRSDFIVQALQSDHASELVNTRKHLKNRFVVALHLPVPQSYWFDKESVTKLMNDYASLISDHKDIAFILFPRRLYEAPDYFINQLESLLIPGRCEIANQLKPKRKQSYTWYQDLDMVVGCSYSDVVLEALSFEIPAVSYSNIGAGVSQLEEFDSSLSVYNLDSLSSSIKLAKKGLWPSVDQWKNINNKLTGKADGKCISRIKYKLSPFIKVVEEIRS